MHDSNGFFSKLGSFIRENDEAAHEFYTQVSKESTGIDRKKGMRIRVLFGVISVLIQGFNAHAGEESALSDAFRFLNGTQTGAGIHERAKELEIPISLGLVSKTDMIATRKGEGKKEKLRVETRVVVAMNKDPVFQALDLAHELTHATESRPNPFDPKLDPMGYVRSGIEGVGGEASAIRAECTVGKELLQGASRFKLKSVTKRLIRARCAASWSAEAEPHRWIESFYNLGHFYSDFLGELKGLRLEPSRFGRWRQKVHAKSPLFSSAVTHKPYPLALLEEYVEITRKVCGRAKEAISRSPSSVKEMHSRCQTVGMELKSP